MWGLGRKAYLEADAEKRIVEAISHAESHSMAEIRVHLASRVKIDVYKDAVAVFRRLGMHKTELRNAVLIYVVPPEKQFAVVGDVGIHQKVTDAFWHSVRDAMTQSFREGHISDGIIKGVDMAGEKLKKYFPLSPGLANPNELSDDISRG